MNHVKPMACFSLLGTLVLFGCFGGDDKAGDHGSFRLEKNIKVLEIVRAGASTNSSAQSVEAAKSIKTVATQHECKDGILTTTKDTSLAGYRIQSGKLTSWNEVECNSTTLSGMSTDIIGDWTQKGMGTDSIPADIPHSCIYDTTSSNADLAFKDVTVAYKITETNIHMLATGNLCMGEILLGFASMMQGFSVSSHDCNSISLKDTANKVMTMSNTVNGQTTTMVISYNGKTCSNSNTFDGDLPPDCAKQKQDEDAFNLCVKTMIGDKKLPSLPQLSDQLSL